MGYSELRKLYYNDREAAEKAYQERYSGEYTHHIQFQIGDYQAFFVVTPDIHAMQIAIQKADKHVCQICGKLPGKAIQQFSLRCLIDEIVLTNNIEGVHSTRREIDSILSTLEEQNRHDRFRGLVQKYVMLQRRETIPLRTCSDIRTIYDDLALAEVIEDNPKNRPDGKIFRKDSVSVYSATQKEIHQGLYPEDKIISAMEQALAYLNDEDEELLYRTAVFHYLIGYIHPFYDGNGRLNRFISSYMISKELEPVLGYRLSYTIKENIDKYYRAFEICNHPLNRGDLTPFVAMFLEIIRGSIVALEEALNKRWTKLNHYQGLIQFLPDVRNSDDEYLYTLLVQAELFSEHGISTKELLNYAEVSRGTLKGRLDAIGQHGFLKSQWFKREKWYGLDLNEIDKYVERLPAEVQQMISK